MKLEEAIEVLAHLSTAGAPNITLDEIIAVKLGKEALMAIRTGREDYYEAGGNQLPGETKK